jgi:hypothetical protein
MQMAKEKYYVLKVNSGHCFTGIVNSRFESEISINCCHFFNAPFIVKVL